MPDSTPPTSINNILIVGGGTAGWLAAAYLSQELGTYRDDGVKITLVEASDIPTIGVGEGTFPSLRRTLDIIGVNEWDFMRECDATFKQGIKFINWRENPSPVPHHYYHLFEAPRPINNSVDIAPYWILGSATSSRSFAESVSVQEYICESNKAPKTLKDNPYSGSLNYAYHLDAGKFAEFLKKRAKFARVKHIIGTVDKVNISPDTGYIESVKLNNGDRLNADLFIDCTGFESLLIGKTLGAKLKSVKDTLFVDKALTIRLPYDKKDSPIPSATLSTAHQAGWSWDIGLRHRRGVGFVYSSTHMSDSKAEQCLQNYLGSNTDISNTRNISIKTGYRTQQWTKNCIALGLSGGFLEPLEATGISLIESALRLIADYFPRNGHSRLVRQRFNNHMTRLYENAVVFIKMHYCLSQRTDNEFWNDNRLNTTIPDELKDLLELWAYNYPRDSDFPEWQKTFGAESYLYVLLGMGALPNLQSHAAAYPFMKRAEESFKTIRQALPRANSLLPSHRDLIESLHR